jgi:hypothetical protein
LAAEPAGRPDDSLPVVPMTSSALDGWQPGAERAAGESRAQASAPRSGAAAYPVSRSQLRLAEQAQRAALASAASGSSPARASSWSRLAGQIEGDSPASGQVPQPVLGQPLAPLPSAERPVSYPPAGRGAGGAQVPGGAAGAATAPPAGGVDAAAAASGAGAAVTGAAGAAASHAPVLPAARAVTVRPPAQARAQLDVTGTLGAIEPVRLPIAPDPSAAPVRSSWRSAAGAPGAPVRRSAFDGEAAGAGAVSMWGAPVEAAPEPAFDQASGAGYEPAVGAEVEAAYQPSGGYPAVGAAEPGLTWADDSGLELPGLEMPPEFAGGPASQVALPAPVPSPARPARPAWQAPAMPVDDDYDEDYVGPDIEPPRPPARPGLAAGAGAFAAAAPAFPAPSFGGAPFGAPAFEAPPFEASPPALAEPAPATGVAPEAEPGYGTGVSAGFEPAAPGQPGLEAGFAPGFGEGFEPSPEAAAEPAGQGELADGFGHQGEVEWPGPVAGLAAEPLPALEQPAELLPAWPEPESAGLGAPEAAAVPVVEDDEDLGWEGPPAMLADGRGPWMDGPPAPWGHAPSRAWQRAGVSIVLSLLIGLGAGLAYHFL